MANGAQHTLTGLSGWARRLGGRHRAQPLALSERLEERLQSLSLDVAGCTQLHTELPPLLAPFENALNLNGARRCLLPLLLLPGHGEALLIRSPQAPLPPGTEAFIGYQFDASLKNGALAGRLQLPLPASDHLLLAEPLPGMAGWLLLLTDTPLDSAAERELVALAAALARGLAIWSAHQQRLEQAVSDERRAHAAELHDSLAQILGYLRLRTSRLDAHCSDCDRPELQALAADLSQQTRHAYRLLRDLISSARLTLEGGSLHSALAGVVREFEQRSALVFELDDRCPQLEPDEGIAIQLLMIVREALCNAVRHAHASHLRVQLLPDSDGKLRLRIEDNGQGLDDSRRRHDSFGLGIMQERAARIGAQLCIGNRPGGGTRIELQLDGPTP